MGVTKIGVLILAGFLSAHAAELKNHVAPVSAEDLESYSLVDLQPVYFLGRTTCSGSAKVSLIDAAKQWPKDSIVEIRGYADGAGSAAGDILLSGTRAEAIAKILTINGIAAKRIRVVALGAIDPEGPSGDAKHQRVDVRVFVAPPTGPLSR